MTPEEKIKKIRHIIEFNFATALEMGIPLPDPIKHILSVIDGSKQKENSLKDGGKEK